MTNANDKGNDMIDRYDVCNSGEVYKFDHGEWVRYDEAQARIAELEVAVEKAQNKASRYRRRWKNA